MNARSARPTPRPRAKDPAPTGGVAARIIRLVPSASGRGTIVTIDKGTQHGVTVGSTGYIVDDDGSALKGGSLRVIDAQQKTSRAEAGVTRNQIAHRRRVRVRVK